MRTDQTDSIGSYLPCTLLGWLPRPPKGPATRTLPASVLSVDISGFTHLTERLVEQESTGMERLSRILNGFYGELIRVVEAHDGELMTIVGDGVLSTFPAGAAERLAESTQRAACCGLELGRVLDGYRPDADSILRVRTGLGAGALTVARLGQLSQWELSIGGDAVAQAVAADRLAPPGAFAISDAAWTHLRHDGQGRSLGERFVELTEYPRALLVSSPRAASSIERSELLSYLPPAVRARVLGSEPSWQSELRHVSVIFLHLRTQSGAELDIEDAQDSVALLQNLSGHFGGGFDKLVFDDKGTIATVVFGLPPRAHEDDPRRAVAMAVEAHDRLGELGIAADIGVATGRAFWGPIGAVSRREYCLIGSVMNLGARLMQSARNEVLCCPTTRHSLVDQIEGESIGELPLKGFSHKVAVFRARATSSPPSSLPGAIGRADERRQLAALVELAKSRRGGRFWIEAEAGLGKSALVADLQRRCQHAGVSVLVAAGDSIENSTPYHAFRNLVSFLLRVPADSTGDDRLRLLTREVNALEGLEGLAPLLSPFLQLAISETARSQALEGQARADRVADLVVAMLRTRSEQPLVLVLEDMHWFDSASLRLAQVIHKRLTGVPLVATTRPVRGYTDDAYAAIHSVAQPIPLLPMPDTDITNIVAHKLGARAVSPAAARFLHSRAEGNPFFAEALSTELLASNVLAIEHGVVSLQAGADWMQAELPRSLDAVIGWRIDRLAPAISLTLKTASAVGRVFRKDVVSAVHPDAPDSAELDNALHTLAKHGLIVPLDGPGTYGFDHAITREVTYVRMPHFQREELHRRIARYYENLYRDELPAHYPLLAHHHERARNVGRAVELLELSAEQALVSGAFREVVHFLERALALAPANTDNGILEGTRRARFHRIVGEALDALGDKNQMAEQARLTLALLGKGEPEGTLSRARAVLRNSAWQIWFRFPTTVARRQRHFSKAVAFELTRAHQTLGAHYFYALDPMGMVTSTLRATNAAELTEKSGEIAKCHSGMALILGVAGRQSLAKLYATSAIRAAASSDDPTSATRTYVMCALYFIGVGDFDKCADCCDSAARLALEHNNHAYLGEVIAIRTWSLIYRGQKASIGDEVQRLRETARQADNEQVLAWATRFEASQLMATGRHAEAVTLFDEAHDVFCKHGDHAERFLTDGSLALAMARSNRQSDAASMISGEVLDSLRRFGHPTSHILLQGLSNLLEALALVRGSAAPSERSRLDEARRLTLDMLQSYAKSFPIGRPRNHHFRGLVELEKGHRTRARLHFIRGLSLARSLRLSLDKSLLSEDLERL